MDGYSNFSQDFNAWSHSIFFSDECFTMWLLWLNSYPNVRNTMPTKETLRDSGRSPLGLTLQKSDRDILKYPPLAPQRNEQPQLLWGHSESRFPIKLKWNPASHRVKMLTDQLDTRILVGFDQALSPTPRIVRMDDLLPRSFLSYWSSPPMGRCLSSNSIAVPVCFRSPKPFLTTIPLRSYSRPPW
jgi:hypothetical protein